MKVSELIILLEKIKEESGDALVTVPASQFGVEDADTVTITDDGRLLIE